MNKEDLDKIRKMSLGGTIGGALGNKLILKRALKKKKIVDSIREKKKKFPKITKRTSKSKAQQVRDKVMNTGAKVIGADKLVKAGYETGKALGKAADAYSNFFRKAGQATRRRIDSEMDARRRAEENAKEKWRKLNR